MKYLFLTLLVCLFAKSCLFSQMVADHSSVDCVSPPTPDPMVATADVVAVEKILSMDSLCLASFDYTYEEVLFKGDSLYRKLILDTILLSAFWDSVPQPLFWRKIMNLTEDSAFMNVYDTRVILDKIKVDYYRKLTDEKKVAYRDSLRKAYCLSDSTRILFSTGKQFYYQFQNALSNIDESIPIFIKNGVDPWYAQSILLIESPNKLQKSSAGAYGPFQLMKYVAQKQGLTVNKSLDERKDVKRSAYAASMFLKKIAIPETRTMLDTMHIEYNESDLWFKLMVMHAYHAGSGNVKCVVKAIAPTEGGLPLIFEMWQTQAGGFKNASQNYSQVLIAALMELNKLVENNAADRKKYELANKVEYLQAVEP